MNYDKIRAMQGSFYKNLPSLFIDRKDGFIFIGRSEYAYS